MAYGLLTESDARELLEPFLNDFCEAVQQGWNAWDTNPARFTASKRTRASLIHDEITNQLERAFAGDSRVRLKRRDNSLLMSVDGAVMIKVKKLRRHGLSSDGILTNARANFLAQMGDLSSKPITNLVLGYRLDELEVGIEQVYLTCPLNNRNLWVLELVEAAPVGVTLFDTEDPAEGATIVRSASVPAAASTSAGEE